MQRSRIASAALALTLAGLVGLAACNGGGGDGGDDATPDASPPAGEGLEGLIAFTARRDGLIDLWVRNPDGSDERRLTDGQAVVAFPAFSPDGERIAYARSRDPEGELFDLYIVNVDGSDPTALAFDPEFNYAGPAWSPDGERIAFHAAVGGDTADIYVIDADGGNLRQLTDHPAEDSSPDFSPDGSRILFSSNREDGNFELFTMDTEGGDIVRLTETLGNELDPHWSPDGTKIVYSALARRPHEGQYIYTINADGGGLDNLTQHTTDEQFPTWSPDGGHIIFARGTGTGTSAVILMKQDGTEQQQFIFPPAVHTDWWAP